MEAQSQGACVPEHELTKNLLQIQSSEVARWADGHSSGTDGGGANTPCYFPLCVPTGGLHHVTFPPSVGDLRTERVPRKGLLTEPATDGLTLKNTTRQGHTICYLCLTHVPQSLLDAHVSQDHLQVAEVREHLTQSTCNTREIPSCLCLAHRRPRGANTHLWQEALLSALPQLQSQRGPPDTPAHLRLQRQDGAGEALLMGRCS